MKKERETKKGLKLHESEASFFWLSTITNKPPKSHNDHTKILIEVNKILG